MKMIWSRLQRGPAFRGKTVYRGIVLIALSTTLFGALPLATSVITSGEAALTELPILSDWHAPVCRSLALMLICAPLCLLIGFICGSRLADSRKKIGVGASLLLIPMLLGGGVDAFVFKLCFIDATPVSNALQNRNPGAFWLAMLGMFLWQYVPCVTFFCWLVCGQISSDQREFVTVYKLSFFERLADIYWPKCQNLLIYLFLLLSAACASEFERSALVFRASQGTGTEFFSHWLLKAYFMIAIGLALGYIEGYSKSEIRIQSFLREDENFYRTGDLGCFADAGDLMFLGRQGSTINRGPEKVRLVEIEAALGLNPNVAEAAVTSVNVDLEQVVITAYYCVKRGNQLHRDDLESFLHKHLGVHALPDRLIELSEFPMTPSGKIARRLLPEWEKSHSVGSLKR